MDLSGRNKKITGDQNTNQTREQDTGHITDWKQHKY